MILVVDDEPRWIATYLEEFMLEDLEYELAVSVDRALEILESDARVTLILADIMMPPGKAFAEEQTMGGRRTGLAFIKLLRSDYPHIAIIVLTNVGANRLREVEALDIPVLEKAKTTEPELVDRVRQMLRPR